MDAVRLIITLLMIITLLAVITRRFSVPYPVVFVIGGILLSFIPRPHPIELNPQLVFLLLMPPILFSAAFFTSWRDFRANIRPISLLALLLVTITTFTIAAVFKWFMPAMPWSVGCVLGAIISPPDAVAATAVTRHLKIPRRIITILEGESLINDASGLILYKFAVAAVLTGAFSFTDAVTNFLVSGTGGILLGAGLGWLVIRLMHHVDDAIISTVVSLLAPFIIFIIAEKTGLSAVLAVVVAGLVAGRYAPKYLTPHMRLKGAAVWETIIFIMNGIAFVLIGLQLPFIIKALHDWPWVNLIIITIAVVGTTILVRCLLIFCGPFMVCVLIPSVRRNEPRPPWQGLCIVAWSGMRGIVSLGAALALPLTTVNGVLFPARDLIILLAFASIVGTLVFQGLTLPLLIKWLGVKEDVSLIHEEKIAREAISKAMLNAIHEIKTTQDISQNAYDIVYRDYLHYMAVHQVETLEENITVRVQEIHTLRRNMLAAGRTTLIQLRQQGKISDEVLHIIQAELDLDEVRLK